MEKFPLIMLTKLTALTPGPRAGPLWPHGYNLSKVGKGSLDAAPHQLSRL